MVRYFGRCLCVLPEHPSCTAPAPLPERTVRDEWPIKPVGGFDRDRMKRHNKAFKSRPITKPENYPY